MSALSSVRFRVLGVIAVVVFAAGWNAQALALHSIRVYQLALARPAERIGLRCRFTPTCSRYAEAVIRSDGVLRGGWRTVKRVARCGPWTPWGTLDPP